MRARVDTVGRENRYDTVVYIVLRQVELAGSIYKVNQEASINMISESLRKAVKYSLRIWDPFMPVSQSSNCLEPHGFLVSSSVPRQGNGSYANGQEHACMEVMSTEGSETRDGAATDMIVMLDACGIHEVGQHWDVINRVTPQDKESNI